MMNSGNKQIESNNLKVIKDQLGYEALMNKKCTEYEQMCNDAQIKSLCCEASKAHKQNFTNLKNYLDSHQ